PLDPLRGRLPRADPALEPRAALGRHRSRPRRRPREGSGRPVRLRARARALVLGRRHPGARSRAAAPRGRADSAIPLGHAPRHLDRHLISAAEIRLPIANDHRHHARGVIPVETAAFVMARILILWNQIDDDVYEHYRRDNRRAPDWDPTLEIEPWETVEE